MHFASGIDISKNPMPLMKSKRKQKTCSAVCQCIHKALLFDESLVCPTRPVERRLYVFICQLAIYQQAYSEYNTVNLNKRFPDVVTSIYHLSTILVVTYLPTLVFCSLTNLFLVVQISTPLASRLPSRLKVDHELPRLRWPCYRLALAIACTSQPADSPRSSSKLPTNRLFWQNRRELKWNRVYDLYWRYLWAVQQAIDKWNLLWNLNDTVAQLIVDLRLYFLTLCRSMSFNQAPQSYCMGY